MEITVKRRTWFLGWLIPLSIKFNRKTIGSVGGFHTRTIEIPEEAGILTYEQPLDRTDRLQVKNGDVVLVKETVLSKILNILVVTTFLYSIGTNTYISSRDYYYESNTLNTIGIILLILLLASFIISLFFNSYKFVIEDKSFKE